MRVPTKEKVQSTDDDKSHAAVISWNVARKVPKNEHGKNEFREIYFKCKNH